MRNGYIFLPPAGHRATARLLSRMAKLQVISYEPEKSAQLKGNAAVFNWGNSSVNRTVKSPGDIVWLNSPEAVARAVNKIESFKCFREHKVPHPDWTLDENEAKKWHADDNVVYTRTKLTGHSGEGIVLQTRGGVWIEVASAKVHTKRFNGKEEYRIHVFNGEIIHTQQKKRKADSKSDTDFYVKNLANGYIFAINDVRAPDVVNQAAIAAVVALGLNFGAVDLAYSVKADTATVFEVNTRPNLTGTTLTKYAEAFSNFCK